MALPYPKRSREKIWKEKEETATLAATLKVSYRNWKGETRVREIEPKGNPVRKNQMAPRKTMAAKSQRPGRRQNKRVCPQRLHS